MHNAAGNGSERRNPQSQYLNNASSSTAHEQHYVDTYYPTNAIGESETLKKKECPELKKKHSKRIADSSTTRRIVEEWWKNCDRWEVGRGFFILGAEGEKTANVEMEKKKKTHGACLQERQGVHFNQRIH